MSVIKTTSFSLVYFLVNWHFLLFFSDELLNMILSTSCLYSSLVAIFLVQFCFYAVGTVKLLWPLTSNSYPSIEYFWFIKIGFPKMTSDLLSLSITSIFLWSAQIKFWAMISDLSSLRPSIVVLILFWTFLVSDLHIWRLTFFYYSKGLFTRYDL